MPQPRLPVLELVQTVFRLLWRERDDLLRLGFVPLLISVSIQLALLWLGTRLAAAGGIANGIELLAILLNVAGLIAVTLLGVPWQRLVLLGPQQASRGLGLTWTRQHWQFFVRFLALIVAGAVLGGAIVGLAMAMFGPGSGGGLPSSIVGLSLIAVAVLSSRLSLAFPASALGATYGFAQSWRDTAGFSLRLLLLLVGAVVPILLANLAFTAMARVTGLVLWAPFTLVLVYGVLAVILWTALLTAIALAFRSLALRPGPSPAAPQ